MTTNDQWQDAEDAVNAPSDEWTDIEAESQIILEQIGDGFMARFMGMDPPNANGIIQAHFITVTHLDGTPMLDTAFMNATRDLVNKLAKVPAKAFVRIQWESNLNTGHESGTPMRVFKVQWKR